jgi:hypothetical protein
MRWHVATAVLLWAVVGGVGAWAQHEHGQGTHDQHQADIKRRGAEAMGFNQDTTTHHFTLTRQGGVIQVTANSAADTASRDHIRHHLMDIAKRFPAGDFSPATHTHGQAPPGSEQMTALSSKIHYKYEEIERGGQVVISSRDPAAVKAIHEFLRFQIKEHQTGDPLAVK